MKKLFLLIAVCCAVQVLAQSAMPHQKFTTPTQFDWTPDGSGLYVTVVKVDTEKGGPPQHSIFFADNSGQLTPVVKDGSGVSVSPDGKKLAFVRTVSGERFANNELYVFDLETKTERLLFSLRVRCYHLTHS